MRFSWLTILLLPSLAALVGVAGCSSPGDDDSADPDPQGPVGYWTSAAGVFDEHGRQITLKGVNVPTQESTPEEFAQLASWGMNTVRQVYFWADVEPVEGQYDEAYLAKLDQQVALASANGMFVLIDHHQHCYGAGFGCWGMPAWTCDQQYYDECEDDPWNYFCDGMLACFELFWTGEEIRQKYIDHLVMLAARYADEPAVIGFDVINEPFCMHTTVEECGAQMGDFYSDAAEQIGAVAPDKLIFFEPNFIELAGLSTNVTALRVPNKGVYAAHYYLMEVHDGGDYDLDPGLIEYNIDLRAEEAVAFDVPLFVGEFGGMAYVANFDQYIDDNLDLFDSHRAGSAYWLYAYGDGFHMLDDQGAEKPFLESFVRPYPKLTPGVIESLSFEFDTMVMSLTFAGDATIGQPGELYVPARHYGDGFTLTGCDEPDCSWSHDPAGQAVTFTVSADGTYLFELSPT